MGSEQNGISISRWRAAGAVGAQGWAVPGVLLAALGSTGCAIVCVPLALLGWGQAQWCVS